MIRIKKLIFGLLLVVFIIPLTIQAQTVVLDPPTKHTELWQLIDDIIDFIFYLSMPIAAIMIIVAGYFFITAMGDPEKILRAKKMILWTLIGLLVIISAKGLIELLGKITGVKTPYNK